MWQAQPSPGIRNPQSKEPLPLLQTQKNFHQKIQLWDRSIQRPWLVIPLCWAACLKILFTSSAFVALPGAHLSFVSIGHFISISYSITRLQRQISPFSWSVSLVAMMSMNYLVSTLPCSLCACPQLLAPNSLPSTTHTWDPQALSHLGWQRFPPSGLCLWGVSPALPYIGL